MCAAADKVFSHTLLDLCNQNIFCVGQRALINILTETNTECIATSKCLWMCFVFMSAHLYSLCSTKRPVVTLDLCYWTITPYKTF